MSDLLRRRFLQAAIGASLGSVVTNVFGQTTQPDLLVTGGRLIDPAKAIDKVLDIAVTNGKVTQIAANIPRAGVKRVFDAAGKIVTPGLIDMHGHVYDRAIPTSIDPDEACLGHGVTTVVDAGSAGAATFPGFRKYVIDRVQTRVYALLNISTIGLVVTNELYIDAKLIDPKAAIATIQANPGVILGIKCRINGKDDELDHDVDALKKAREAADATGVPIMLHWTNQPRLLDLLKKGDILVHPFNPARSGPNLLGADGKVLPQIRDLKPRGIFTDFAHGSHLQWETAEKAAAQDWFPDTISTDIHRAHVGPNGTVGDLVTTMSKFLMLGLPLPQVIERVTANPAKELKFPEKLGTLEPGVTADITILEEQKKDVELLDTLRQKRTAHMKLTPVAVVRAGALKPLSV